MAVINKQQIRNPNGVVVTYSAASAGGDQINGPGADLVCHIKNASGASITATFITPGSLPNGDPYPDKAVAVAAGGEKFVFLDASSYADANNQVSITWSATASVTFAGLSTI